MNVLIVEDNKELAVEVYDFLCKAGGPGIPAVRLDERAVVAPG